MKISNKKQKEIIISRNHKTLLLKSIVCNEPLVEGCTINVSGKKFKYLINKGHNKKLMFIDGDSEKKGEVLLEEISALKLTIIAEDVILKMGEHKTEDSIETPLITFNLSTWFIQQIDNLATDKTFQDFHKAIHMILIR